MNPHINGLQLLKRAKTASAVLALCGTLATVLSAQTFTVLHNFCVKSGCPDGYFPISGLVQATNGNLYSATEAGGTYDGGTVFALVPSGRLTTLYNFCSQGGCLDGGAPGTLVQATNGNLYGTTAAGGLGNNGTVFKMSPGGKLTTLHDFCASGAPCTDGFFPNPGLVQAANGDLYGTTQYGGSYGEGAVFRMSPSGALTTIHSFCAGGVPCADGYNPLAGLVQATSGSLYGSTPYGGAYGGGTVFQITSRGALTTLYNFCAQSGCADGKQPLAALIEASDGNLYGTTAAGGANGAGAVFQITLSGNLTTLYSFCSQSGCADGQHPSGTLVQATDGNIYGTAMYGGTNNGGTLFQIALSGAMSVMRSFCSQTLCKDGANPVAGLVQHTNGALFGVTQYGGAGNRGTLFSLSVGLSPFVKTLPAAGKVGVAVKILGTNLTGATSVTFNGAAATFTVVSKSEITTTVPAGATTGQVQVVTPGSTLASNIPFYVL